jgi:hypothetical protein
MIGIGALEMRPGFRGDGMLESHSTWMVRRNGPWLAADKLDLGTPTGPGSQPATLTFAIHAVRQFIFLSPGQGQRVTLP